METCTISTTKGKIRGEIRERYTVFKGIPYAKAPIGELRFAPPQEAEDFRKVYDALAFSNRYIQRRWNENEFYYKEFFHESPYMTAISEDALYLNVWAPRTVDEEKKPVVMWIHGGAFMHGWGHEPEMDGAAWAEQGIVFVSINYRLGALGFFAHPLLGKENPKGISGNYGLLDQIAALKWIYENIEGFGGDPNRITVMGQSAGSRSVQNLVSSSLTGNMIHQAIMQSGGGYHSPLSGGLSLEKAMDYGEQFLEYLNVDSIEKLRVMPAELIMQKQYDFLAYLKQQTEEERLIFTPNIDGYILTDTLDRLAGNGKMKDITYMIGATKDDIDLTNQERHDGKESAIMRAAKEWSFLLEELGRKPAYVYCFAHDLKGDDAGAFHSSELWYEFGTYERCWRPMNKDDETLSRVMIDEWTAFVKTGCPNRGETSLWSPCTKKHPFVRIYQ